MTGAPPEPGDAPCGGPGPMPTVAVAEHAMVEQYGDLHEYGLSLGVDLDADAEEDLLWAVKEAFNAALPSSWTEYMDENGRAYYIKDGSTESTWEHPMDSVYRELFEMVKDVRARSPPLTESQREDFVRQHLKQVHQRAKSELEGWSGPYASEQGEYYYSESLKVSIWDCPVVEWEKELALRHAVLSRYLLPEQALIAGGISPTHLGSRVGTGSHQMLQALRLQLGNLQKPPGSALPSDWAPEPSTSRSFHTARSQGSSRSGRTKHSHTEGQKERKERKERRHRGSTEEGGERRHQRSSEERRAGREAQEREGAAAELDPGSPNSDVQGVAPYCEGAPGGPPTPMAG